METPFSKAGLQIQLQCCGVGDQGGSTSINRLYTKASFVVVPTPDAHLSKIAPAHVGKHVVSLRRVGSADAAQSHIRILPNGALDFQGGKGPWACFEVIPDVNKATRCMLRCIGHEPNKTEGFLCWESLTSEPGSAVTNKGSPSVWWEPVVTGDVVGKASAPVPTHTDPSPDVEVVTEVPSAAPSRELLSQEGCKIQLRCPAGLFDKKTFVVEVASAAHLQKAGLGHAESHVVSLAVSGDTQHHLRIPEGGAVDFKGGKGKWALFEVMPDTSTPMSNRVALRSIGHDPFKTKAGFLCWEALNGGPSNAKGESDLIWWEAVPSDGGACGLKVAPLNHLKQGTHIRMVHHETQVRLDQIFVVDGSKKQLVVNLALRENPAHHLRINQHRKVDLVGGTGAWAQFQLLSNPDLSQNQGREGPKVFSMKCVGHDAATPVTPAFLGISNTLEFTAVGTAVQWSFQIVSDSELAGLPPAPASAPPSAGTTATGPPVLKSFPAKFAEQNGTKEGDKVRLALASQPEMPAVEPFVLKHGTDAMCKTFASQCPVQFSRLRQIRKKNGAGGGNLRIHRAQAAVPAPTAGADSPAIEEAPKMIDSNGGHGAFAHFDLIPLPPHGPNAFALRCLAFRPEAEPTFLGLALNSQASTEAGKPVFVVSAVPVPLVMVPLAKDYLDPTEPKVDMDFKLTNSQRDEFAANGFLILKDVVPLKLVDEARRVVNFSLGKGPAAWTIDPDDGTHKLPSSTHTATTNLIEQSQVWTALQRIFGKDNIVRPGAGQQAMRFPVVDFLEAGIDEVPTTGEMQYHIDGMKNDKLIPFNILVKVPLSDQRTENNGNFTVFPRSHRNPDLLRWYHEHVNAAKEGRPPNAVKPNVGRPFQVCMGPGDAALVHPHLAHCVGRNSSPNIRYSVIFRMQHVDKAKWMQERLTIDSLVQDSIGGIQILPNWEADFVERPDEEGTLGEEEPPAAPATTGGASGGLLPPTGLYLNQQV